MGINKDTTANTSTQYVTINAVFPIHNGAVAQLGERFNGVDDAQVDGFSFGYTRYTIVS